MESLLTYSIQMSRCGMIGRRIIDIFALFCTGIYDLIHIISISGTPEKTQNQILSKMIVHTQLGIRMDSDIMTAILHMPLCPLCTLVGVKFPLTVNQRSTQCGK